MVNQEELAICRRRGHVIAFSIRDNGWSACEKCGMWLRETTMREEREDEPPEDEQSPAMHFTRNKRKGKA